MWKKYKYEKVKSIYMKKYIYIYMKKSEISKYIRQWFQRMWYWCCFTLTPSNGFLIYMYIYYIFIIYYIILHIYILYIMYYILYYIVYINSGICIYKYIYIYIYIYIQIPEYLNNTSGLSWRSLLTKIISKFVF